MQLFGSYAVVLAFVLAVYALAAGLAGHWRRNARLIVSAQRATVAVFPTLTVAVLCLLGLIFRNDFTVAYVAEHSNRALPFYFKIAVLWSGQEGSLLFWSWLLSGYAFVVLLGGRLKPGKAADELSPKLAHRDLVPLAAVILAGVEVFFLALNSFAASAFASLPVGTPADGNGLNPLLQYSQMDIHPPLLYLGYVGFAVPFAFCLAALIKRYPGDRWIHITRRWTMVAWLFLTIGIILGGNWAYRVLGWGGYWAWDPVENAAFLPWLTGTAFLHSVMMQEKRGMLKIWNVWLVFATFLLAIFGDFLTRSGLVSSVHAFAQSSIGGWFVVFLAIAIAVCLAAFWKNKDFLKSENPLESTASREAGFLFNNFVLLVAAFAILWGTLFPVISEWVQGQTISVGRGFFDRINVPIFLFLLFLTGVGPLLAWRRTSIASLKRNFLAPGILGLAVLAGCWGFGLRDPYPVICFGLAAFVLAIIGMEFYRGARVLSRRSRRGLATSVMELTLRNTRRYGGYVIHVGIILLAVGIAGSGFNQQTEGPMPYHHQLRVGPYTLTSEAYTQDDNDNFSAEALIVRVRENGRDIATMYPARRFYKASNQSQSMVADRSTLLSDLYLVYAGDDPQTNQPILHAYWNPLIVWIWIGALVIGLGTIIALLPGRPPQGRRESAPERVTEAAEVASV